MVIFFNFFNLGYKKNIKHNKINLNERFRDSKTQDFV